MKNRIIRFVRISSKTTLWYAFMQTLTRENELAFCPGRDWQFITSPGFWAKIYPQAKKRGLDSNGHALSELAWENQISVADFQMAENNPAASGMRGWGISVNFVSTFFN